MCLMTDWIYRTALEREECRAPALQLRDGGSEYEELRLMSDRLRRYWGMPA